MSRSSKKGPYIDPKLLIKARKNKAEGAKVGIKTWSRDSRIAPEFVGLRFLVHNGKEFKEVFVTESHVGHCLGEFSPTRYFRGHGQVVKRTMDKT